MNILKRITGFREFMILAVIVVACVGMGFKSEFFMTWDNWKAMLMGVSFESIVAIGMTMLMVSGGFDLSVGSNVAFSGAVTALCLINGAPVGVALLAGLATGTVIGVVNGLIIARVGINPFITTLAMMWIVRGGLMVITKGRNISGLPDSFKAIGQGYLGGVQYPIVIALALMVVGDVVLRKVRFFRQNYYIGGNEKAAMVSGIPVNGMKVFNYCLTGFLCAVAGIIMTARFGSASVTTGEGLELKVISAVIIGGASLQGGEGTVLGAFLGSLLMAILVGSLTLLGVDISWNKFVIGTALLLAVMADVLSKRGLNRK